MCTYANLLVALLVNPPMLIPTAHIGPILSRPPFGEVDLTETKNKGAG